MKRFSILAAIAMIFSFYACDVDENSPSRDSDTEITKPDNNGENENPGDDNGGDNSQYEVYNNTFTYGYAGYCGQWYEDQPANVTNWYIELADDNYDLENYEGTGYNIVFDLFAAGTNSTSIPNGRYTVEAFDQSNFSAGSLLYGYIAEDEEYGEYPAGTWLYEGDTGIAGATSGWVQISGSGSSYTITYELNDDDYQITFKGSFKGTLTLYDATQSISATQITNVAKAAQKAKSGKTTKRFMLRR